MKKMFVNILLVLGVIVPVVMLLWSFLCCLAVHLLSFFSVERKEKHGCVKENNERQS